MKAPTRPLDISKLAKAIQKKYGPDSAAIPGNEPDFMLRKIRNWIPAGKLNGILGHSQNGMPCGYYAEISGGESAGKTTLAYWLLGQAQRNGAIAILADVEHSYDVDWSAKQGVNNSALLRIESAYLDEADEKMIVENVDQQFKKWEFILNESKKLYDSPQLLVVDSLAALLPKEQLEGDYGERSVGALARAMAVNLPKFHSTLIETNTACVFINQIRDKIGVMFGSPETTPGGKAKNFYFFVRVDVKRLKVISTGKTPTGILSRIKNKKNKVDAPFLEFEMTIDFKKGAQL